MTNLQERDGRVIWHPYTQAQLNQAPIGIVKGEGVYLVDETGKRYIDAISSWWVNIHGHAHPYIAEKLAEQARNLEHVIFAGFTHEPAVRLAERLLEILPANQSRIFYSDNGSTSVEVAIKMALQFWHNQGKARNRVIALEHAYHGDTFGAMSVSSRSSFTNAFSELLFEVIRIPFPAKGKEAQAIEALKSQIKAGGDRIAAFIAEPLVLGAGGMLMYEAGVLDELFSICKQNNILTIADEVLTGFGRTGRLFASDHLRVAPDIICLSKALTGGTMPLGATSCTAEIFDAFLSPDRSKTFFHGHSYTANPLACAAALASLDLLLANECRENINRIGEQHRLFLELAKSHRAWSGVRTTGTIIAMDFVSPESTSYFHSLRDRLYDHFIQSGVLLRPLGNTVYIMPPYCISNDELAKVYRSIEDATLLKF